MSELELISTAEAAKLTGHAVATIARWVTGGKLTPAYKIEGRTGAYLFHREEIEALAREDANSNA